MKLKQSKTRNKSAEKTETATAKPTASKAKATGVGAFIAEQAAKKRGVSDWHARKPGSRAL